jgi:glycosyltransferase involved in cell wall biosynthesis
MRIGFDAKRAFFNKTGLGNYSRSVISGLAEYFPQNSYYLYSPRPVNSDMFCNFDNCFISGPSSFYYKSLPSVWRTFGLAEQLRKEKIEVYHGLTNELPAGIEKTSIFSVVTIADLIFLTRPELYKPIDRMIYTKKVNYAVRAAQRIVTISKKTAEDLINLLSVDETKIRIVYPGCDRVFWNRIEFAKRKQIFNKYGVPEDFILSVGTIEERKNVLAIVKALYENKIDIPLVVIGRATSYLDQIKNYIVQNKIRDIFILHNVTMDDLPCFYQQASAFVYPSFYEGFGIPILEALVSMTPVITSKGGCFAEAGGEQSIYIDPENTVEIADAIKAVLNDNDLRRRMIEGGLNHARKFKDENIARAYMDVYEGKDSSFPS